MTVISPHFAIFIGKHLQLQENTQVELRDNYGV